MFSSIRRPMWTDNWPKWAKIEFMRKIDFWSKDFWGVGSAAFQRPTEGQKMGSVVVWHTGHFAIHHSMDISLQETFPINQLA